MQIAIAESLLENRTPTNQESATSSAPPGRLTDLELKSLAVTKYEPPPSPVSSLKPPPSCSSSSAMKKFLEDSAEVHWMRKRSGSGDTDMLSERDEEDDDQGPENITGEGGVELECSICWAEFEAGDSVIVLPCNDQHRFHERCIGEWLVQKSSLCPICRQDTGEFLRNQGKGKGKSSSDEVSCQSHAPSSPSLSPRTSPHLEQRRRVGEMSVAIVSSAFAVAQGKVVISSMLRRGHSARVAPLALDLTDDSN